MDQSRAKTQQKQMKARGERQSNRFNLTINSQGLHSINSYGGVGNQIVDPMSMGGHRTLGENGMMNHGQTAFQIT